MLPLEDVDSHGPPAFWVIAIILINVYVFYLEITSPNPDAFILKYSLIPSRISFSHPATLLPFITSQFLHAGFIHIFSNMLFFWVFGNSVARKFGLVFFPIFYLLSGFVGGILQYVTIIHSTLPNLGASGAIAGVLGAYFALYPHNRIKTLVFIIIFVTIVNIPATLILFYWFIIQIFSSAAAISNQSFNNGGVAYFAHIGGFSLGWLVSRIFFQTKRSSLYS